ncbi:tRNA (adenosine(37)-N6)-threonylcarbamoyltransferase complex dimerization subunit type 1 TsaB [Sphingomonas morindae]|uniref:tRNA (Adenosine(37)-N6)-threonylcarbamoyltransferase complex dimerization subunit type 1 TsaB n=1 Tax=Sphingomonas morindae TaxID=1541170 RepID=A0ABY4X6S2_9SPHN|nr:tRNA (adenosine(37)-N6)-threonylcarbamoyltransferase complex dimerization subunit type 1 TsaB [Sphingomonas morindae]USI72612.1 tRNA (adenosine(37)-N6)-threonylcarbamoyltransferase complex dimerization subunit type 1 TsaB [Sphingomonas morindae]
MAGLTLALDTATAACSAALIRAGLLVTSDSALVGRGHAERLVPMVEALLDGARPDRILVDCGPGSFTGVRVGLAAAIGLGLGWGVPVLGYESLDLLALAYADANPHATAVAVALSGGHGELFVRRYALAPVRPLGALDSLPPETAAAQVEETVVIGSGAGDLVAARGWGEAQALLPDAAAARLLPEAMLRPPVPVYGRAPDAARPA